MAQIRVADISRWQGRIDWDKFAKAVNAVVIKATGYDGGGYVDGMFTRNRDEARRVGIPRWFYHYKGAGSASEQAAYMVSAIGGLQANEAIVLDDENEGKVNPGFIAEFADKIQSLTGLVIPVYSNQNRFTGTDLSQAKSKGITAWVAKYGNNDGSVEGAGAAPNIGDALPIIMWQYTSTARVDGVTENTVDMNVFYGDLDAFKKFGAPGNVAAPSTPVTQPSTPAPGNGTYTVVKDDTLSGIAAKLGIADWRTIAATNGIVAPYTIFPGQILKVYGGTTGQAQVTAAAQGGQYVVVSGDTLSGIGVKTGHNWQQIADLNGIKAPYTIYPGQRLNLPGGAVTPAAAQQANYVVVSGDNLTVIGQKTGRDWKAIASLNGIQPPYTIYPNQVLRLP